MRSWVYCYQYKPGYVPGNVQNIVTSIISARKHLYGRHWSASFCFGIYFKSDIHVLTVIDIHVLTHIWRMGSPIIINWMSPFLLLRGVRSDFYFFIPFFPMKFLCVNRIAPDGTLRSAASHLGLCCLPMSHKKDARFKWVNCSDQYVLTQLVSHIQHRQNLAT